VTEPAVGGGAKPDSDGQDPKRPERILIVDDDIDICRYVQVNLVLDGYEVAVCHDGEEGLQLALETSPDLVLLDVMMPGLDGTEVCRRLRSDPRTLGTAVIFLTAKTQSTDKIAGLSAGADDYISKPFDPPELSARVRSALRRNQQMRDVSPLTGLPGNVSITAELDRRVADTATPFAVAWADLDNFKAFNDYYGFLKGDEAIKLTGRVLTRALEAHPWEYNLVGHIGGDDFVLICDPAQVEPVCRDASAGFDQAVMALYEAGDLERGYIEVEDRRGELHRFPLMTISIGVATSVGRRFETRAQASQVATEMKSFAKAQPGSAFEIDRRRNGDA